MNIIVCCKAVPEEQDIVVMPDGSLSTEKAAIKPSLYDLNAMEAGVQLLAGTEGKMVAIAAAGSRMDSLKIKKDVLSRGPDELIIVQDSVLDACAPYVTAQALAAAATRQGYDLILCGEGSADLNAQQTGLLLGEMLAVPAVNAVSKITFDSGKLIAERTLENEVEVLEINLPAVISVTTDINIPAIPNVKAILGAGKKPVSVLKKEDLGLTAFTSLTEVLDVKAPKQAERKQIIVEGDGEESVAVFVDHLRKELN